MVTYQHNIASAALPAEATPFIGLPVADACSQQQGGISGLVVDLIERLVLKDGVKAHA